MSRRPPWPPDDKKTGLLTSPVFCLVLTRSPAAVRNLGIQVTLDFATFCRPNRFPLFQPLYALHEFLPCLARLAVVIASQAKALHEAANGVWINALCFRVREAGSRGIIVKRVVKQESQLPILLVALECLKHLMDKCRLLYFGRAGRRRGRISNLGECKGFVASPLSHEVNIGFDV